MVRIRHTIAALAAVALLVGVAAAPAQATERPTLGAAKGGGNGHGHGHPTPRPFSINDVLADNDGWGSQNGGTRGGAGGAVYQIRTWDDFRAHAGGTTPRILVLHGDIRAFAVDGVAQPGLPSCSTIEQQVTVDLGRDITRPFSMRDYIDNTAEQPGTVPRPEWEEARLRAAALQTQQVRVTIGSNITIVGEDGARIEGAHLYVNRASQVILRNFESSDAYDCFPEWDPTDGALGNWNALYDNVSVMNDTTNVWVDHLTLNDGIHPPSSLPTELGRKFEVHDGLLDITHSASYVTVSNSVLESHDKTSLVGSSDNRPQDEGRLKVTWRTNLFHNLGQRVPRVRYGDVDVYNNLYSYDDTYLFQYALGVGVNSSVIAEHNAFRLTGIPTASLIRRFGGTQIRMDDNLVNGTPVDVLAAYNASASAANQLANSARWSDPHRAFVLPVGAVEDWVLKNAGAGHGNRGR